MTPPWIVYWKDAAGAIQATLASIGIIAAGTWGLWLFVKQRQRFPHANVEHRVTHWSADDARNVLRLTVRVANVGNVMLALQSIQTSVHQLEPTPDHLADAFAQGSTAIEKNDSEVPWSTLDQRTCSWSEPDQQREIEPGESDEYHFDFLIPIEVRRVALYSYVQNVSKRRDIGWNVTTVYAFDAGGAATATSSMTTDSESRGTGAQQPPKTLPPPPPKK